MHGEDPLLGGDFLPAAIGREIIFPKVASQNVTSLTAERLKTILVLAASTGTDIIVISEAKHSDECAWGKAICSSAGWLSAFSKPPPLARNLSSGLDQAKLNRVTQGGTLIIWRRGLGRAKRHLFPFQSRPDRAVLVKWANFAVVAAYGPQSPDGLWFNALTDWANSFSCPVACIGDFNWKQAYEQLLPTAWRLWRWEQQTVLGTQPSAIIANFPVKLGGTQFIPGLHHHGFLHAYLEVPTPEVQLRRLRRSAQFVKSGCDTSDKIDDVSEQVNLGTPNGLFIPLPVQKQVYDRSNRLHPNSATFHDEATQHLVSLHMAEPCEDPEADVVIEYSLQDPDVTKWQQIASRVQAVFPKLLTGSLYDRWRNWHSRAELAMQYAVEVGLLSTVTKAEVGKGMPVEAKPTAPSSLTSRPEPIVLRRFRALHRKLSERLLHSPLGLAAKLKDKDLFQWRRLVVDGQIDAVEVINLENTLDRLNDKITEHENNLTYEAARQRRKQFMTWNKESWKQAARYFKPALPAGFNAQDMADDWTDVWQTTSLPADAADQWLRYAELCNMPSSNLPDDWVPEYAAFEEQMLQATGAAGLDGWTHDESRIIALKLPWLCKEAHGLLCETSNVSTLPTDLEQLLWSWRTVGIPKRKTDEARPIAVGCFVARAWSRCCLSAYPANLDDQWCGRSGSTVMMAIADWLQRPAIAGKEEDLTKAFDLLSHDLIEAVLRHCKIPTAVRNTNRHARTGPRICQVSGEIANPIMPTNGIPQGDSCSPAVLALVLLPWVPAVDRWLFMDDRSYTAVGPSPADASRQIADARAYTKAFDRAIGLKENEGKLQEWSDGDRSRVEHLGVSAVPDNPLAAILPRDGWEPTADRIRCLGTVPGSQAGRERLAAGFITPLYAWCAPIIWPPPVEFPKLQMRAILRTSCTWWCSGRFWADRIALHPHSAAAFAAFKQALRPGVVHGEHFDVALSMHAQSLSLRFLRWAGSSFFVGLDPQASDAIRHKFEDHTDGDSELECSPGNVAKVAHTLRSIARIRLLHTTARTRFDSAGVERVDVEALSSSKWKGWRKSLSYEDDQVLRLFRGGCSPSDTRRGAITSRVPKGASRADYLCFCCPWCGEAAASMRHMWAECPNFQELRDELGDLHNIPLDWWLAQPTVTSKSGWITVDAHTDPKRRVVLQIAACHLGIRVLHAYFKKTALTSGCRGIDVDFDAPRPHDAHLR